jgi:citrate synthase
MPEHRLLTAESAAARLGVSRATLYAYVSRGFIHAHAAPDDPRRRLYSARDVDRFAGNKTRGRKAADIAAATLDYGLPALASGITLIEGDRLFYRGSDAARLAVDASVEETARLLWDRPVRDRSHRRLDRARAGAAGRRQGDPPARPLHRAGAHA